MLIIVYVFAKLLILFSFYTGKPRCFSTKHLGFVNNFRDYFFSIATMTRALAELISDEELTAEYIIPKAFDKRVGGAVAAAVAEAARRTGVARI